MYTKPKDWRAGAEKNIINKGIKRNNIYSGKN
jgi:hypothetical protein